jgi:nitroreductase
MASKTKIKLTFVEYDKEALRALEPETLGGLLRERVHHNIEVPLYPTVLRGKQQPKEGFGLQAQMVFDVWREKGLPEHTPDMLWVKRYLELAAQVRAGEPVDLEEPLPTPFSESEMKVVCKLLYGRRSIRDWEDRKVPAEMIDQILEAGRAAPIGCNLGHLKFVVLTDPEEKKWIWSDISTKNAAVIIVICHDRRVAETVGQDLLVPQNPGFDAAAAADHMLLMAHALGLGGVWLSELKQTAKTKDTGAEFRQRYGLPEHFEVDVHIAVGWTAIGSIKSARPPLSEMVIRQPLVRGEGGDG